MGYALRNDHYRYVEWVFYDRQTFEPDWTEVTVRELYDKSVDPNEDWNVAEDPQYADVIRDLSAKLRNAIAKK